MDEYGNSIEQGATPIATEIVERWFNECVKGRLPTELYNYAQEVVGELLPVVSHAPVENMAASVQQWFNTVFYRIGIAEPEFLTLTDAAEELKKRLAA